MDQNSQQKSLHIGLVGAGIGGLAAAIAIRLAGAEVTVLEAASELGEIGAGIQMTPNVSRLLIKWGIADIIGDNLVEVEEFNLRQQDGTKVGYTKMVPDMKKDLGHPYGTTLLSLNLQLMRDRWWVVHRAHLHSGLVEVAQSLGVKLLINSRVNSLDYSRKGPVTVTTEARNRHVFDLLIGSDGVNSVVRRTLFPDVRPTPPSTNSAYRAIVPYSRILKDPIAKTLIEKPTMEVWLSEKAYIITYPISGCKDLNLVLSHHTDNLVYNVEDVAVEDLRKQFEGYDLKIKRVIDMIPETQRWPLLVTALESWSSPEKNVVLMGDAAHSMVNHMAQGAATAMEDGAFIGRCIAEVVQNRLTLTQAVEIYEKERMPKARAKQHISFLNGAIWHLPAGPKQEARDGAMKEEMSGKKLSRSPNLYSDPRMLEQVYGYDAEQHADEAVRTFLQRREGVIDT
ncbi:FAD-dependent monooxygenase OpS4 [Lachnellula suecica]|uniref:FAD-dependent monooxygenase OpS4 n=1 Tax=Lachnellula suecica TaxID=602035 RepID=A0A8T9C8K0_9HELO|nr:FAD-dependent monooxygenase OpS4 [Lachnellula suecica]